MLTSSGTCCSSSSEAVTGRSASRSASRQPASSPISLSPLSSMPSINSKDWRVRL